MAANVIKFDFNKAEQLHIDISKNREKAIDCLGGLLNDVMSTDDWWEGDSHDAFWELFNKNALSIKASIDASEKEVLYVKNVIECKEKFEKTAKSIFT